MGRRKKVESIKVAVPAPTTREVLFTCHECGDSKSMAGILCIQNKGPLCYKCGGYDEPSKMGR